MTRNKAIWLALVTALGCGGSDGELRVTAFGLAEAEDGIPASRTADGFAVEFDELVLAVDGFFARTATGDDAMLPNEAAIVDLTLGESEIFSFSGVPAGRWDEVGFRSAPPSADSVRVGTSEATAAEMIAEGWSFLVSGTLVADDGERQDFRFGFPVEVTYRSCISGRDQTLGIVVPENGVGEAEVTWHLTHIFFDSFAEDSALRVEPFFAAAEGDPVLTVDMLSRQPLADLRGRDGRPLLDDVGNPVLFIPPPGGAETLREHLLNARFGHFDGLEGFCTTELTIR
ncbi:MAG: hypothetical protein AAF411_12095 [Myxococcota bacterium]